MDYHATEGKLIVSFSNSKMGAVRAVLLAVSASGAVGAALARAGIFDQLPIHKPLNSIKSRLNRKPKVVVQRQARVTPVRPAAEGARSAHAHRMIAPAPRRRCRQLPRRSRQVSRRSRQPSHATGREACLAHLLTNATLLAQARRRAASLSSRPNTRWYARCAALWPIVVLDGWALAARIFAILAVKNTHIYTVYSCARR